MIKKWVLGLIANESIRKAVFRTPFRYQWEEEDFKNLEYFIRSATGAKLLAHLDSVLQAMLMDASAEEESTKALHKLATAKGFGLALGAIRLSMPQPVLSEEVEPENVIPFVSTKSQPTIF